MLALLLTSLVAGPARAFDFAAAALEKPDLTGISHTTHVTPLTGELLDTEAVTFEKKSTSKAVLYSLLLPGLGQSYLGDTHQAKIFYGIEAVILTSFVVFVVQEDLREEEYQEYARAFAGVTSDHSDDFYGILTSYDSSGDYEDEVKSEGRLALYPNVDTADLNEYFVRERVADYEAWIWESADHRRAYQDRRAASKSAERNAMYAVAAAVANRVASALFAYRSGVRANREGSTQTSAFSIEWETGGRPGTEGLRTGLSLIRNF